MDFSKDFPKKARHPALQVLSFILKTAIAAAIICWLVQRDFPRFKDALLDIRPEWLLPALGLNVLQLVLCAWRWRMLLAAQGVHLGFGETFSLVMQGNFFSLAIPVGAVGGDLVKAGMVAARAQEGRKLEGVLSIVADRITGMIGLFCLTLLSAALFHGVIERLSPQMKTAFLLLMLMSAAGLAAAVALLFQEALLKLKPLARLKELADNASKGAASRTFDAVRLYKKEWRTLLKATAISALLTHPVLILCLFCLVKGVTGDFPPLGTGMLAASFGNTASSIPLTPGGIGTRDMVSIAALNAGGIPLGPATAAPLLYTAIVIFTALLGSLFFIFGKLKRAEAGVQKGNAEQGP